MGWRDVWYIETNCGYGWRVESEYYTLEEAEVDLPEYIIYAKAYNGNARIFKRRYPI